MDPGRDEIMWDFFEDLVVGILALALIKILNDVDIEAVLGERKPRQD